ncbi:MAG: signal peptide peptidase SppA [Candidatus Eisenbacteria bacterium]
MSSRRGVLLLVLALVVTGTLLMLGAQRLRGGGAGVASRLVLTFDVPSSIDEDSPEVDLFSPGSWRRSRLDMFEMLEALREAADDDRVRAVVLHVGDLDWGWAKLSEFREAILELRAARKPVYVSLKGGGEPEIFLASAATFIALPPASRLQLDGLTASALFMRGTLDKIGVRPNFLHVGRYKSAVEGYTRTDLSEPAREALAAVLGDTYGMLAESLASARRTSPDSVRAWMDRGPYSAIEAHELGLVDTLLDRADLDSLGFRRAGRGAVPLKLARYADRFSGTGSTNRIALVTASGAITTGRSRVTGGGERILGAETLIEALRRARTRSSVRAIVLRIDSPGGDAAASDEIWHEVDNCRRVKPVIVSMSDVAASGGYYIAAAADTIVAQPATITGSIGIYGGKFNVLGLYEKLGLSVETLSTGPRAQMYSPFSDFTEAEAGVYAAHLRESYERFLEIVASGRERSTGWADSVGQGRIWSGTAALDRGLVDLLGGLELAIDVARIRAGFDDEDDFSVERFPEPEQGFLHRMFGDLWDPAGTEGLEKVALIANPLRALESVAFLGTGAALALMPFIIAIR